MIPMLTYHKHLEEFTFKTTSSELLKAMKERFGDYTALGLDNYHIKIRPKEQKPTQNV